MVATPQSTAQTNLNSLVKQWWKADPVERKALRQTARLKGIFARLDDEIKKGRPVSVLAHN